MSLAALGSAVAKKKILRLAGACSWNSIRFRSLRFLRTSQSGEFDWYILLQCMHGVISKYWITCSGFWHSGDSWADVHENVSCVRVWSSQLRQAKSSFLTIVVLRRGLARRWQKKKEKTKIKNILSTRGYTFFCTLSKRRMPYTQA